MLKKLSDFIKGELECQREIFTQIEGNLKKEIKDLKREVSDHKTQLDIIKKEVFDQKTQMKNIEKQFFFSWA